MQRFVEKNVFNRYSMKEIIFVRHGKSSWEFDVIDRDRPLAARGVKDAKLVAEQFLKKVVVFLVIFFLVLQIEH